MRVLIVEDEALIAQAIRRTVRAAGFEAVAIVATVEAALAFLGISTCDAAILDVNLRGQSVEPVAAELVQRRIPFLGLTGSGLVLQINTADLWSARAYVRGDQS